MPMDMDDGEGESDNPFIDFASMRESSLTVNPIKVKDSRRWESRLKDDIPKFHGKSTNQRVSWLDK